MASPPVDDGILLQWVDSPDAVEDLTAYFEPGLPADHAPWYSGSRFESLAGGGDRPEIANRIVADDLVAVSLLAVDIPGDVALRLLEGRLGDDIAALLARIPADLSIHEPRAAAALDRHSPAWLAWELLDEPHGMGPTKVSKLLARKRPRLVPVWDDVVRCGLGRPDAPWEWMRRAFHGPVDLAEHLVAARSAAGVPATVTPLRVLDVIVWMRHAARHGRTGCPGPRAPRIGKPGRPSADSGLPPE